MREPTQARLTNLLYIVIVLVSLLVPRFTQIERPITVDELTWLTFSADFYYGLASMDYQHTYQDHHPGVTTMLAGTAAYLIEFPGYRGIGLGYMENDTFKLIDLLEQHGVEMFDILVTARRLMAAACVLGLLLCFWFLWRTFGAFPAFSVIMFVALDPFTIGQTRLYSHEGFMSVLVLLSWLSFFHYLKRGRHWTSFLFSALAAGFAALTKITSLALIPLIGFFWLVDFLQAQRSARPQKGPGWKQWLNSISPLLIWTLLLVVVFIAVWPAMWADPVDQFVYLVNHTRGFSSVDSSTPLLAGNLTGRVGDYLASIWSHPTLITWLGVFILGLAAIFRKQTHSDRDKIQVSSIPFLYNLVVLLVLALVVKSMKAPRYMASVHLFLAFSGGMGYLLLLDWLKNFSFGQSRKWVPGGLLAALLIIQALSILPAWPYYYTYTNPLRTHVWWNEHGAFLDQAADYLAQKPGAEHLTVMTYSPGSFMFFFPGQTLMIVPTPGWAERDVANLTASDYLVVDHSIRYRDNPMRIIADIAGVQPETIISYQGRELVWIYRVADLPPAAFIPDSN